jgi:hypothetical protein
MDLPIYGNNYRSERSGPRRYLDIEEGEAEPPGQDVHRRTGVLPHRVPYLHSTQVETSLMLAEVVIIFPLLFRNTIHPYSVVTTYKRQL